jgi:hypothetical protein
VANALGLEGVNELHQSGEYDQPSDYYDDSDGVAIGKAIARSPKITSVIDNTIEALGSRFDLVSSVAVMGSAQIGSSVGYSFLEYQPTFLI